MNTISNSVKAQLFALYFNQRVFRYDHLIGRDYTVNYSSIKKINHGCYLQLRSVSDLNQLEIEIIKYNILGLSTSDGLDVRKNGDYVVYKQNNEVRYPLVEKANIVHQYLRSISIALPFTYLNESNHPITLSVEELVNLNWVKMSTSSMP